MEVTKADVHGLLSPLPCVQRHDDLYSGQADDDGEKCTGLRTVVANVNG